MSKVERGVNSPSFPAVETDPSGLPVKKAVAFTGAAGIITLLFFKRGLVVDLLGEGAKSLKRVRQRLALKKTELTDLPQELPQPESNLVKWLEILDRSHFGQIDPNSLEQWSKQPTVITADTTPLLFHTGLGAPAYLRPYKGLSFVQNTRFPLFGRFALENTEGGVTHIGIVHLTSEILAQAQFDPKKIDKQRQAEIEGSLAFISLDEERFVTTNQEYHLGEKSGTAEIRYKELRISAYCLPEKGSIAPGGEFLPGLPREKIIYLYDGKMGKTANILAALPEENRQEIYLLKATDEENFSRWLKNGLAKVGGKILPIHQTLYYERQTEKGLSLVGELLNQGGSVLIPVDDESTAAKLALSTGFWLVPIVAATEKDEVTELKRGQTIFSLVKHQQLKIGQPFAFLPLLIIEDAQLAAADTFIRERINQ